MLHKLLDVLHKQVQCTDSSERKLDSMHYFLLYAEMEAAEGLYIIPGPHMEKVGPFSGSY